MMGEYITFLYKLQLMRNISKSDLTVKTPDFNNVRNGWETYLNQKLVAQQKIKNAIHTGG